jgi:GDP-D-mannose 3',5'-epimerase
MVDMNEFAKIALAYKGKEDMPLKHIDGPMGVRGRNSNSKLILEKLQWEPTIKIKDGLRKTIDWIEGEIEKERKEGNTADFSKSEVVQQVDDSLMQLGNEESTV